MLKNLGGSSDLLLSTKLTIPPIRQNMVNRQRLIDRLESGLVLPLTVVTSPPGFGKTTLVCAWTQQTKLPVGWLTIDPDDNDVTRFIQYLYAAVRTIEPDLPELKTDLLKSPSLGTSTLVTLLNNLNRIRTPFVLVLDDYQEITLPLIHDVITYIVEHMPNRMHIIITSRADPPLPLARLRARGQLNEIRAIDLKFMPDEINIFLSQIMGLKLRPEDISALESRTEGWIAGLQLAALSMQNKQDLSTFVATFTGSHEYIVDYLTDEVLNQQSEEVRQFLLETCLLNRLCGALCDEITDTDDGQQMLEFLHKANLFLMPLDNRREWYRYHRLFADLLRQRLQETFPDSLSRIHAKASHWFEMRGFYPEAIEYALEGQLYERAVTLIDQIAERMLMRSELTTLLNWVGQIPEQYLNALPTLNLFIAWAAVMEGNALEQVEKRLETVVGIDDGKADSFRAFTLLFQGNLPEAEKLARQALSQITDNEQFLMSATTWILNLTSIMNTDLQTSKEQLEAVAGLTEAAGNVMMTMMTMCHVAEMTMRQGHLHTSRKLYERVLDMAVDDNYQPLPISGMAYIGLAELAREWGNLDEAQQYVETGMPVAALFSTGSNVEAYIQLARIYQSRGDYEAAQIAYDKAAELAKIYKTSEIDDYFVELLQTRLWIAQGRLDDAKQWVVQRNLDEMHSDRVQSFYDYHIFHHEFLTVARLRIVENQPTQAIEILNELLQLMEKWGWLHSRREIELQVLRAISYYALNNMVDALNALTRAMELAEPGDYNRTFIEEGNVIAELLKHAVSKGISPNYAVRLLKAFDTVKPYPVDTGCGLQDALSERELEILQLIAAGLSNPEIAAHLFIAIGTVKAHTSSIYSKLSVNNRIQAVERARELKLL